MSKTYALLEQADVLDTKHLKRNYPAGHKICSSPHHKGPRWTPLLDFNIGRTEADGTPKFLRSYCRCCSRINDRIKKGIKLHGKPMRPMRERYVNGVRPLTDVEKQRRYLAKPEKRAMMNENRRFRYDLKRAQDGRKPRYERKFSKPHANQTDEMLPLEPFQKWLEEKVIEYGEVKTLASLLQVHPDSIKRWRRGWDITEGKRTPLRGIPFGMVDWCLTNEGGTLMFELYPDH